MRGARSVGEAGKTRQRGEIWGDIDISGCWEDGCGEWCEECGVRYAECGRCWRKAVMEAVWTEDGCGGTVDGRRLWRHCGWKTVVEAVWGVGARCSGWE